MLSPIAIYAGAHPGSRGIDDKKLKAICGKKPNIQILGATDPKALEKYTKADQVMCF